MNLDDTAAPDRADADSGPDPSNAPTSRLLARVDALLDRLGLRGYLARDCLLAVLTTLLSMALFRGLLEVAASTGVVFAPVTVTALAVLTCVQSLAVCVRRRNPVICVSIVVATQVGIIAFLPPDSYFHGLSPFIVAYTCGTLLPSRRLPWVLAAATVFQTACGAWLASTSFVPSPDPMVAVTPLLLVVRLLLTTLFSYIVPGLIGNDVATRRKLTRLERLRAAEAVETQRERANSAVRTERTRMARELHDIAAHHLSGMVVQAGAAERLVGKDEAAARETMSWIRSQGKETLHNLRLVAGALREPEQHVHEADGSRERNGALRMDGAPVPGIGMIDRLVEDERALGTAIDLVHSGQPYDITPVADVTFYRVAQEALSNAREHARGAQVHVTLHHGESQVVLHVENHPGADQAGSKQSPRGLGLIGMRERSELIGAMLDAGPRESGGWGVRLTLPFAREMSVDEAGAGGSEG